MKYLVCLFAITGHLAWSQIQINDSLNFSVGTYLTAGSSAYPSFWLASNTWGMIDFNNNAGQLFVDGEYYLNFSDNIRLSSSLIALQRTSDSIPRIGEGYASLDFFDISLWIGRRRYQLGSTNETLSSGSIFLGRNAIPDWGAGLAILEWSNLPFTKGYVQVKGGLMHKWPENMPNATNPLLHEKFAYIKSGKLPINPFIGMNHMAYFGGVRDNGTRISDNFWEVFFAQPASDSTIRGEVVNVLGGHLGLLDMGFEADFKGYSAEFHWQKIINDRISYGQWFARNRDKIIGLTISTPFGFLEQIHLEYMKTDYQNGRGIPDPTPPNGPFQSVPDIVPDIDGFLGRYFDLAELEAEYGFPINENTTLAQALQILEQEWNRGYQFGGRSDYLNKYLYSQGFTNFGRTFGNPLMLTRDVWQNYGDNPLPYDRYVVNNRVRSFHLGASGQIRDLWNYNFLFTFSRNYGSYSGKYQGRFNWPTEDELQGYEYPFEQPLDQVNSFIGLGYNMPNLPLTLQGNIGIDFGDLTNNFGTQLKAVYHVF